MCSCRSLRPFITDLDFVKESWFEYLVILLMKFRESRKTNVSPQFVYQLLQWHELLIEVFGRVQVSIPILLTLFDDSLHGIDVGMNLPEFLDMSHLFLHQGFHLLLVF